MASLVQQKCATLPESDFRFCIVGEELKQNESFMKAVEHFNLPVVYGLEGIECNKQDADYTVLYILNEFDGDIFAMLHKAGERILGPTAVMHYANQNEFLPKQVRPLYTASMKTLTISFTGFRIKEELSNLVALVHHMGGSVRRDFNMSKNTHLVAAPSAKTGEKYKYAVTLGIPVMSAEWIIETWARRHDLNCCATSEELMRYKLLPFVGCKLAFLGYQKEEAQHMAENTIKNGGEIVDSNDITCTHLVIEDGFTVGNFLYERDLFIVKNEWFWACIQMEAKAQEGMYFYSNPSVNHLTSSSFIKPVRGNKRKRNESVARQLAMGSLDNEIVCIDLKKKTDVGKLSISGSFLDATMSPDKPLDPDVELEKRLHSPHLDVRFFAPRQQVCHELYQTESNYVGILHTIITLFKEPLENPEQVGGELLAPAEIKIIFGNLLPIYEIHQNIRKELSEIIHNWTDDHSIGNIIIQHAEEFKTSYRPFVNFFEKTKSLLATCDATKPRFHAFLKRCQSKPECGRQTLQELLIRPVQRLPSIILLLNDILKHTPKCSPDYQALEEAVKVLKEVLSDINENKRITEGQVKMFDIVNDIENCPPNLLSSHRDFVTKVDVQEVTDLLNKKGGAMTLFLFTDVLEICKKRGKTTTNNLKSPGVVSLTGTLKNHTKIHKHVELIQLSHIKRVADVVERDDCKNAFSIVVKSNKELKEILFVFVLLEEIDKSVFLKTLCRQIANSVCKADSDNLLTSLEPEQLDLHFDPSGNVLTKALSRTKSKLGRVWSIKKTPTKRGLSRAISTFISPSRNSSTPANSLGSYRLSSVSNLTELVPQHAFLAPSPVVGRKRKSTSLGTSFGKFNL